MQAVEGVPGNVWVSVNITSLSKLDLNTVQLPASRYTDCATPAHWKVASVVNSSYIFLFEFKIGLFAKFIIIIINFLCTFCRAYSAIIIIIIII